MDKIQKLLTLEDLVKFCKEQNFSKFSSKSSGYQLSVQIPATFEIEKEEYQDNTLMFGKIKVFHIGPNRNGSSVTKEAAQKALDTFAYKPLLANFCEIDGVKDFTSHDMEINEDGAIKYLERQIGCFTADYPVIQYDETTEKEFIFAKVAIPREYTDACSIIESKNGTKVSAELIINEMSYSAKNNILELTDIIFQGATCLGKNPKTGETVEEGMQGARLDIIDFSKENNSITSKVDIDINNKLFEILEKLDATISNFNIKKNNNEKGVNEKMNKLDELLALYGLTTTELEFEVKEGISDEDLEAKFIEAYGEVEEFKTKKNCSTEEGSETGEGSTSSEGGENDEKYSLNYAISHEDIRCGLYNLLNASMDEDSYAWICEVFDNHFIYEKETWDGSKYSSGYYKQSYSMDGDNISFSSEPVEVFSEFVTSDEKAALAALRLEYAELKTFKENIEKQELQAKKDAILNDEKYSTLKDNEKFEQLKKDAAKFSIEEVETQAKLIFADAIMEAGNYSVSSESIQKKNTKIGFNFSEKPKKLQAYAGLFDE